MDASSPPHEAHTLLIVDDEPLMTDVFRQYMTKRGYRVRTAASGREALESVGTPPPADVVVTDMTMPDMDGAGMARGLLAVAPGVPVIIVTGHDLDQKTLDLPPNVVEIVRKPYQPAALAERIAEIVAGREV